MFFPFRIISIPTSQQPNKSLCDNSDILEARMKAVIPF